MICPACGEEYEITIHLYRESELHERVTVVTGETAKTKMNPEYRLPDLPDHWCVP